MREEVIRWKCPFCNKLRIVQWRFGDLSVCDYCLGEALKQILKNKGK